MANAILLAFAMGSFRWRRIAIYHRIFPTARIRLTLTSSCRSVPGQKHCLSHRMAANVRLANDQTTLHAWITSWRWTISHWLFSSYSCRSDHQKATHKHTPHGQRDKTLRGNATPSRYIGINSMEITGVCSMSQQAYSALGTWHHSPFATPSRRDKRMLMFVLRLSGWHVKHSVTSALRTPSPIRRIIRKANVANIYYTRGRGVATVKLCRQSVY